MAVRIASGNEVIRKRTFITPNGQLTTPEEYFKETQYNERTNRGHTEGKGGKDSQGEKEGA